MPAAYRVDLLPLAARDLRAIALYIRVEHSGQVRQWYAGLAAMIDSLGLLPKRGRAMRSRPGYRELFYGRLPNVYRIIYWIEEPRKQVVIYHIRHGARAGSGV